MKFQNAFSELWRFYPAPLYAFAVILGSYLSLYPINHYFVPVSILVLCAPLLIFKYRPTHVRILLAIAIGTASFALTSVRYLVPQDSSIKTGIAEVELSSVKLAKTPFGMMWDYKGTLKSFIQNDIYIAKGLPVHISIPFDNTTFRPEANFRYALPAKLKTTSFGKYVISPVKKAAWTKTKKLFSFAEWRFWAKSAVQKHIQESIRDTHVGAFLSGMATGDFDDRLLAYELGRFGLQHLMAISGLHFSILSAFLALVLGIFFSRNTAAVIMIGIMSAYFIFLGASASVTRAWIAIIVGLASLFVQKRSSGFNTLGIGVIALVLWEPVVIEELGFQFSFGITSCILLWYSPCEALFQKIFAKRRLNTAVKMDSWDQHGYCLLYFLRQALALSFAVNIIALPLTLYHFHTFPVMGLVYNLFFPVVISLSLILLAIACALFPILPWLGAQVHLLNEAYTQFLLNFAFNLPRSFDLNLQMNDIPAELLMLYALCVFIVGAFLNLRFKSKENEVFY